MVFKATPGVGLCLSPTPEPHQEEAIHVPIWGPQDADELGPPAQSGAGPRAGSRGPHRGQGLRGCESPAVLAPPSLPAGCGQGTPAVGDS